MLDRIDSLERRLAALESKLPAEIVQAGSGRR